MIEGERQRQTTTENYRELQSTTEPMVEEHTAGRVGGDEWATVSIRVREAYLALRADA